MPDAFLTSPPQNLAHPRRLGVWPGPVRRGLPLWFLAHRLGREGELSVGTESPALQGGGVWKGGEEGLLSGPKPKHSGTQTKVGAAAAGVAGTGRGE